MITDSGKYYLYRHIRLDKNIPFYIGIGTKKLSNNHVTIYKRAYENSNRRNKIWNYVVNKTVYTIEIILESNDQDFIKNKEIEFIKLYGRLNNKTGILANMTDGGDGMINRVFTQSYRDKLRLVNTGKIVSEKTKAKLRVYRNNQIITRETIDKIAKALCVKVNKYSLDNKYLETFNSLGEAAISVKGSGSIISQVCQGKRNKHKNFIWKYVNGPSKKLKVK